jgi:O-antigen/teichoic acid export membrane protein
MISSIISKIKSKLDLNTLEVLNKSISSSLVKILGMMAGVFVSIFLGRFLGAEGFGIINLANRIVLVIITVALLGMQPVIVKQVSIAYNRLNWERVGNSLFSAFLFNGIITVVLVILFVYLTPYIANNFFHNSNLETPLLIGVLMIVPMVASRLVCSGLIGF